MGLRIRGAVGSPTYVWGVNRYRCRRRTRFSDQTSGTATISRPAFAWIASNCPCATSRRSRWMCGDGINPLRPLALRFCRRRDLPPETRNSANPSLAELRASGAELARFLKCPVRRLNPMAISFPAFCSSLAAVLALGSRPAQPDPSKAPIGCEAQPAPAERQALVASCRPGRGEVQVSTSTVRPAAR